MTGSGVTRHFAGTHEARDVRRYGALRHREDGDGDQAEGCNAGGQAADEHPIHTFKPPHVAHPPGDSLRLSVRPNWGLLT